MVVNYLICQKTGWHKKAEPVLGCFPKHTIQKQTNRLTVQGQNNYTEQLQKQYIIIIQVQKHNNKIITITWRITGIIIYKNNDKVTDRRGQSNSYWVYEQVHYSTKKLC